LIKKDSERLIKKKRFFAAASAFIAMILIGFLAWLICSKLNLTAASGTEFRDYIQGFGSFGILIAVGIQILQVIIAFIPGEVIEIGIGYVYGWFWGSILCLVGVSIGSVLIFLLVKRFGIKFIEIFVPYDKINEMRFINSEDKLKRMTFILYFIPGTPKDLLTFFFGLTRMTLNEFLTITLFARIPSLVSSTLGGSFIGEGNYIWAVIIFVLTAIISLIGMKLYTVLTDKLKKKNINNKYLLKIIHHNKNK